MPCISYMSFTGIVSFKGHTKTLGQFAYMDADINDVILSCISNMTITGIFFILRSHKHTRAIYLHGR